MIWLAALLLPLQGLPMRVCACGHAAAKAGASSSAGCSCCQAGKNAAAAATTLRACCRARLLHAGGPAPLGGLPGVNGGLTCHCQAQPVAPATLPAVLDPVKANGLADTLSSVAVAGDALAIEPLPVAAAVNEGLAPPTSLARCCALCRLLI